MAESTYSGERTCLVLTSGEWVNIISIVPPLRCRVVDRERTSCCHLPNVFKTFVSTVPRAVFYKGSPCRWDRHIKRLGKNYGIFSTTVLFRNRFFPSFQAVDCSLVTYDWQPTTRQTRDCSSNSHRKTQNNVKINAHFTCKNVYKRVIIVVQVQHGTVLQFC